MSPSSWLSTRSSADLPSFGGGTPTLYEWAGGVSREHRDRVAAWWQDVFGGPATYTDRLGGYARMVDKHRDLGITVEQRRRFVETMSVAADDAGRSGPRRPATRACARCSTRGRADNLFQGYRLGVPSGTSRINAARQSMLGSQGGRRRLRGHGPARLPAGVRGPGRSPLRRRRAAATVTVTVLGSGAVALAHALFQARHGPVVLAGPPSSTSTASPGRAWWRGRTRRPESLSDDGGPTRRLVWVARASTLARGDL